MTTDSVHSLQWRLRFDNDKREATSPAKHVRGKVRNAAREMAGAVPWYFQARVAQASANDMQPKRIIRRVRRAYAGPATREGSTRAPKPADRPVPQRNTAAGFGHSIPAASAVPKQSRASAYIANLRYDCGTSLSLRADSHICRHLLVVEHFVAVAPHDMGMRPST